MTITEAPSTTEPVRAAGVGSDDRPPVVIGPERPPKRRRRRRLIVLGVIVALLIPVGWSYAGYLRAPGDAPLSVRTDDWLRDHGFDSVVNRIEQWWYTRTKPAGRRMSTQQIPTGFTNSASASDGTVLSPQSTRQGQEGNWHLVPGLARNTKVEETFIRPDPRYPSVGVDLVRFNQSSSRLVYVPGTKEPGGTWAWGSRIRPADRDRVIAAFNAGFKFKPSSTGGVFAEGRHAVRPLANGLGSLIVDTSGRVDIRAWTGGNKVPSNITTVRQNLHLIVQNGATTPGLTTDRNHLWGTTNSQMQYTWRSAIGIDAQGRLIYGAGAKMSLTELAQAMIDAGAVRAMQLDIHDGVVTFNWYRANGSQLVGTKLMPSMQRPADRYLAADQRDFFVVEAK